MVVFDRVASNQGTGSAQAGFTVDCYGPRLLFADLEELMDYLFRRAGAVREVEVMVSNSPFLKLVGVVGLVVEPYDCADPHFFEDGDIVLGSEV